MSINRITLKENAKSSISGAKPNPALITLVYMLIVYLIGSIELRLTDMTGFDIARFLYDAAWLEEYIFPIGSTLANTALLLTAVISVLSQILQVGYISYSLGISRGEAMSYGNLFDGFKFFGRAILIVILQFVFVFLWSLLFIIPGIIAAYRYSQSFYIMLDNPDMSALDCIGASKEMMRGRKLDYFVLELSFLGWYILCGLTLGILYIWKMPYFQVTFANFYRTVSGSRDPQGHGGSQGGGGGKTQNDLPWEL